MNTEVKTAPHSKDSEMMVLGCMLTNTKALKIGAEELDDADFYYTEHKIIFQALKTSHLNKRPSDTHLICEELKRQDTLKDIGGPAYVLTLAQYAGTSAYIEEYVEELKNKSLLRQLIHRNRLVEKEILDGPENPSDLIEKLQKSLKELESKHGKKIQIITAEDRLDQFEELLRYYRGGKYLGLRVKTIEEFNEKLLGLRKLNLLAAAPNVGKTALTIQLGLEVILTEPDACLVYFSLEMTSQEIYTRMHLYLTELSFHTLMFGSQRIDRDNIPNAFFTEEESGKINRAKETLKKIGERIQIVDMKTCPFISANTVINYIEAVKNKTKCKRVITIIDYLQVWPINLSVRFPSENEIDKWRIGEMKKIRDAMNDDPLIVISEARKPSGSNDIWGGDLSDVMGSARGTYTPDVVMMLSQIKPKVLERIWKTNNMPTIETIDEVEASEDEKPGLVIKKLLSDLGITICKLEVPKARDGMEKFNILLEFHFHKNKFQKVNWEQIKFHVNQVIKERKKLSKNFINF